MLDLTTPVSMDKCGEVDAVNGAGAPIRETDRTSPEDLWEENNTHIFVVFFVCLLIFLFLYYFFDIGLFVVDYTTFTTLPPCMIEYGNFPFRKGLSMICNFSNFQQKKGNAGLSEARTLYPTDTIRAPPKRGRYWEINPGRPRDFARSERNLEGGGDGFLNTSRVQTFSSSSVHLQIWVRKSIPMDREGLTVLKSILPC